MRYEDDEDAMLKAEKLHELAEHVIEEDRHAYAALDEITGRMEKENLADLDTKEFATLAGALFSAAIDGGSDERRLADLCFEYVVAFLKRRRDSSEECMQCGRLYDPAKVSPFGELEAHCCSLRCYEQYRAGHLMDLISERRGRELSVLDKAVVRKAAELNPDLSPENAERLCSMTERAEEKCTTEGSPGRCREGVAVGVTTDERGALDGIERTVHDEGGKIAG